MRVPPKITTLLPKTLNQRGGFSLVELLVAVAIMGILTVAMGNLFQYLNSQITSLRSSSDIASLRGITFSHFSKPDVCTWQLLGKTIDASTNPSPSILSFTELSAGISSGTAIPFLTAGQSAGGQVSGLLVDTIKLTSIKETGNANEHIGKLMVSFRGPRLRESASYFSIPLIFNVDPLSPPGARTISRCFSSDTSAGCYKKEIIGLDAPSLTSSSSRNYSCDGNGNDGTGAALPNEFITTVACSSFEGLSENLSTLGSAFCTATGPTPMAAQPTSKIRIVCCHL